MPYKDPEQYKAYQRAYHHEQYYADIEASRAESREKYHKYKDPEKLNARHQERMQSDPEYRARTRKRKNDYNKRTLSNQKRRARVAEAEIIEPVQRLVVAERFDWICQLCGQSIDPNATHRLDDGSYNPEYLHVDHIVPLSKGGDHSYDNCQPSHAWCNWSKNNRTD